MKLKLQWMQESVRRGSDANVGARLIQLTSAAMVSHDIYCEERYGTVDGSRIAFLRSPLGYPPEDLWLCDLRTHEVACLTQDICGYPTSPLYRDTIYFQRQTDKGRILTRADMKTLETEEVFDLSPCPPWRWRVSSISPDERYYVSNLRVRDETYGLYRVDLKRGTWEIFHEHADICNPHPQFEPSKGEDILVQHNRGCRLDEEGNIVSLVGPEGATLYVIDKDGGNERPLPVGKPHTSPVTGHECWVGKTGKVILTSGGHNKNEIRLAAPGDRESRLLWNGLNFAHIAASDDGQFFISDDFSNSRIYVGHIESGRMLPLCDTRASCSITQAGHPHAYLTSDNRHVIFNSDHTGLGQVWAADIPGGFLEALGGTPLK